MDGVSARCTGLGSILSPNPQGESTLSQVLLDKVVTLDQVNVHGYWGLGSLAYILNPKPAQKPTDSPPHVLLQLSHSVLNIGNFRMLGVSIWQGV